MKKCVRVEYLEVSEVSPDNWKSMRHVYSGSLKSMADTHLAHLSTIDADSSVTYQLHYYVLTDGRRHDFRYTGNSEVGLITGTDAYRSDEGSPSAVLEQTRTYIKDTYGTDATPNMFVCYKFYDGTEELTPVLTALTAPTLVPEPEPADEASESSGDENGFDLFG